MYEYHSLHNDKACCGEDCDPTISEHQTTEKGRTIIACLVVGLAILIATAAFYACHRMKLKDLWPLPVADPLLLDPNLPPFPVGPTPAPEPVDANLVPASAPSPHELDHHCVRQLPDPPAPEPLDKPFP